MRSICSGVYCLRAFRVQRSGQQRAVGGRKLVQVLLGDLVQRFDHGGGAGRRFEVHAGVDVGGPCQGVGHPRACLAILASFSRKI